MYFLKDDPNNKNILIREIRGGDNYDGLYIREVFRNPCVLKGSLKLDSDKCLFSFRISTQLSTQSKELMDYDWIVSSYYKCSLIADINTVKKSEIDFIAYVWPDKKTWRSAFFYKIKGRDLNYQSIYRSVEFKEQEFVLWFFTNGSAECSNFEYSVLDTTFDPSSAPEIKSDFDKYSKDEFPATKDDL